MQDMCTFLKYPAFLACFVNLAPTSTSTVETSADTTTTGSTATSPGDDVTCLFSNLLMTLNLVF